MVHLGGLNKKQAFALCAGRALFSQGWGGCVPASAALTLSPCRSAAGSAGLPAVEHKASPARPL